MQQGTAVSNKEQQRGATSGQREESNGQRKRAIRRGWSTLIRTQMSAFFCTASSRPRLGRRLRRRLGGRELRAWAAHACS